ncbi:MAG TPA: adenylate/guanylate cyclase domain-containing protein [Methylomirabilota bacterium]|nr:adenylate/guanylate cyclase domain-containing protein [Methylomirabilota bacterium]
MTTQPAVKYAKSGDVSIAYAVSGSGPDVVIVPGWVSNVESMWSEPFAAPFLHRLARFSRLIMLDRRGTGLSDRVSEMPSIEERMDDVRAVMDAAGSQRAVLFGISEGGPMCITFAATYPERTSALALYGTFARLTTAEDYPIGVPPEELDAFTTYTADHWGTGASMRVFSPSLAGDDAARAAWARLERLSVSPAGVRTMLRTTGVTDVRNILPVLRVPTLVLHRRDDRPVPIALGRYVADHIAGARFVMLPGADHFFGTGDTEPILGEVEEFVTGARHGAEADRVLATVMFTDIVGSTARAAELGDGRWRDLLDGYHALVRQHVAQFRGREIDTAGDGFLAAFDGPARAARCAWAVTRAVRQLGLEVRAGLHAGECEVLGNKLTGIAVHTGARVAALAGPGEVLASSTVKDLVAGSGITFEDRGARALAGVPGEWRLYAVVAP